MGFGSFRRDTISKPIYRWAKTVMPGLSDTEREALEAGDVWWDADLFTGNPDWQKFLKFPPATLSLEEKKFLEGPTEDLCQMLDEWTVTWKGGDLPKPAWDYILKNKFLAMIIPKKFGGLEFSAYANSEIIRKIASRSIVGAVTVMVPNSLGPGELLMMYGTKEQQNYWLPRLAKGQEIPCFGLTSSKAGSDAGAMEDTGVICKGTFKGKKVIGIKLNWDKRYITLAPVATVLGLAFKLYDPDHLIGKKDELGITVALIPTNLKGITIGKRHLPGFQMFQNGPTQGKDVFIPLDFVIGGKAQLGKGWKMLMSALAAGRGISLPSMGASGLAFTARTSGAYARVRTQFKIPIGKFEGIQARLGNMAAETYTIEAARRLTCAALDEGHKPAVISAIMKYHATERMRQAANDAMDIHGGKAIMDGPENYLGALYRSIPVGITVEGANILTRNMIIFGQGSIRCHPWLLKEILALEDPDHAKGLDAFDKAFWGHVGHTFKNMGRAFIRTWSNSALSPAPNVPNRVRRFYKKLNRYAASFSFLSDMVFLTLGGGLKRKEMLSARLGDILSELYLLSAVLKRWHDEGEKHEDLVLVRYAMQKGFTLMDRRFQEVLKNLPNWFVADFVRLIAQPFGPRNHGPSDKLTRMCAETLLEPSEQRDRITPSLYLGNQGDPVHTLEKAFRLVVDAVPLHEKMKKAQIFDIDKALKHGVLTKAEVALLKDAQVAVDKVVNVDDFNPKALTGRG